MKLRLNKVAKSGQGWPQHGHWEGEWKCRSLGSKIIWRLQLLIMGKNQTRYYLVWFFPSWRSWNLWWKFRSQLVTWKKVPVFLTTKMTKQLCRILTNMLWLPNARGISDFSEGGGKWSLNFSKNTEHNHSFPKHWQNIWVSTHWHTMWQICLHCQAEGISDF